MPESEFQKLHAGKYYEVKMTTDGKVHIIVDIHVLFQLAQNTSTIEQRFSQLKQDLKLLERLHKSHHDLISELANVVTQATGDEGGGANE